MREDSDGEITLVYEADTPQYHRYKGVSKNGKKEITVYLERFKALPTQIKAIINIENRIIPETPSVKRGDLVTVISVQNLSMLHYQIESLQNQINELKELQKNDRKTNRRKAKAKKHNSSRT